MQQGQAPDRTVQQGIDDALRYQEFAYDPKNSPEDRADALEQLEFHKQLISSWYGDEKLRGTAIKALAAIDFADARHRRIDRQKTMAPDLLDAYDQAKWPRLTEWRRTMELRGESAPAGTEDQVIIDLPPDSAALQEMFQAGDPSVERYAGVANLIDDNGELRGLTARDSLWRSVKERFGQADPAIVLKDDVANMPTGWMDPKALADRERVKLLLYGDLFQRDDGSRYVSRPGLNEDGADRQFDIPNLSTKRMLPYTAPDGTVHPIKITDGFVKDLVKSREGGFFKDRIMGAVQEMFTGTAETAYGEMLIPKITGDDDLDAMLIKKPEWQRAVMDAPRPSMFWYDAGKGAYFLGEFAATMAVTRGIAGAAGKVASPLLTSAAEYTSTMPRLKLAGEMLGAAGNAALGGARAAEGAAKTFYWDSRVIGEFMGYNAISGAVHLEWQPGKWVRDGWNDGVSMFAFGAAARLTRGLGSAVGEYIATRSPKFESWLSKLEPNNAAILKRAIESMLVAGEGIKEVEFAALARRGLLEGMRPKVAAEMVASLYDTAFVGWGMGAYGYAHAKAQSENRDSVSVGDFLEGLTSSEAGASVIGMMAGHTAVQSFSAALARGKDDAVPFGKAFGVRLGAERMKEINDLLGRLAYAVHEQLNNPEHAGALMAGIDAARDSSLKIWQAVIDKMFDVLPESKLPPVASGHTHDQLVELYKADSATLAEALKYEPESGLERAYGTLSNWKWNIFGPQTQDVVDTHKGIGDLIMAEVRRREEGGAFGNELTGQKPSERTRQAVQNLRDASKRERQQRAIVEQWRRVRARLTRVLGKIARRKGEEEAQRHALDRFDQYFVDLIDKFEHRDDNAPKFSEWDLMEMTAEGDPPWVGSAEFSAKEAARRERLKDKNGNPTPEGAREFEDLRLFRQATESEDFWAKAEPQMARNGALFNAAQDARDQRSMARDAELERRRAERAVKVAERVKAAAAKNATAAEKQAARRAKIEAAVANENDRRAVRDLKRAEAKAAERAEKQTSIPFAKEEQIVPPTGEELQAATAEIVHNLETTPELGHLLGNKAAVLDAAMAGRDPENPQSILDALADSRVEAEKAKPKQPRIRLRKAAPEAAPEPTSQREEIAQAWNAERLDSFVAGRNVLHPRIDGGRHDALAGAMLRGVEASLLASLGQDAAAQQLGRQRQESLAMGILVGGSLNAKLDKLAAAVSGLSEAEVAGLREQVGRLDPIADAEIDAVLEQVSRDVTQKPVLLEEQLSGRGARGITTRQLLRLIAAAPSLEARSSDSAVFGGGRAEAVKAVRAQLKRVVDAVGALPLNPSAGIPVERAKAQVEAQLLTLAQALDGMGKGLRLQSPWNVLKRKVAVALTGNQGAKVGDTFAEGNATTIGQVVDIVVHALSGGAVERKRVTAEGGSGRTRGLFEGQGKDASETIRSSTSAYRDPLTIAKNWVTMAKSAERLSMDMAVVDWTGADGRPFVHADALSTEITRKEQEVFRGLIDGDMPTMTLMRANGFRIEDIAPLRKQAADVVAMGQELLREYVGESGMPQSKTRGEAGIAELDHLFEAMQLTAEGDPITGDMARVLRDAGWLEADGRLREDAHGKLLDIAKEGVLGSLKAVEAATAEEHLPGAIDLSHEIQKDIEPGLEGAEKFTYLYAGGSTPREVRRAIHFAVDFATGFYNRRVDTSHRAEYETVSAGGALSLAKSVDNLLRGKSRIYDGVIAGSAAMKRSLTDGALSPFTTRMLRFAQATFSGKSRGIMSESVRRRMVEAQRADAAGMAHAQRVLHWVRMLTSKLIELRVPMMDRTLIMKLADAGLAKDLRRAQKASGLSGQEVWNKVFGPEHATLYPVFLELNDFFARVSQSAVDAGVLTREQAKTNLDQYGPLYTARLAFDADGNISGLLHETAGKQSTDPMGSFEHIRKGEIDSEEVRRFWDPLYVLPIYGATVARRLRVFHAAHRYIDEGVGVQRAEYERMAKWERSQYDRVSSPGRTVKRNGRLVAGFAPGEAEALIARGVDLERELKERNGVDIYQTLLHEFAIRERAARGGKGQPAMTERMERVLDFIDNGYMPLNARREFALMVDHAELARPQEHFAIALMQSASQEWRELRTIKNPRHWTLALLSNAVTNHAAGKVSLFDLFEREGSSATAWDRIAKWHELVKAGGDPLTSNDPDIIHAHRMVERSGGGTLRSMIADPVGSELMPGFMADISRQHNSLGAHSSDALTAEFTTAALGSKDFLAKMGDAVRLMSNSTSPEGRAEAQRTLRGLYQYVDLGFKYAAQIEGERMGMSEQDAWHWGTEGTADFADVNPTIRMFSSQLRLGSTMFKAGRTRLSAEENAWLTAQRFAFQGIGGPFWSYWATMTPTLARSAVNHPLKTISSLAVATYAVQLISALNGDEQNQQELVADVSGRGEMLHADNAAMDALAKNYGNARVKVGPFTMAYRDWITYWKAYNANLIHAATFGLAGHEDPNASMLFRAQGPRMGGRTTEMDFQQFMPLLQTAQTLADFQHTGGDPQAFSPQGGAMESMGIGFIPGMIATAIATTEEVGSGSRGKSWSRVFADKAAQFTKTWSSPFAGLPWIFSKEGQAAIGTIAWDGRSAGEMVDRLPTSNMVDTPGRQFGMLFAQAFLPIRNVQRTSVAPGDDGEGLFGRGAGEAPRGTGPRREGDMRSRLSQAGILNAISQGYKLGREYGGPPGLWTAKALDLERDLRINENGEIDVADNPQTILGQFIRQAGGEGPSRRLLAQEVVNDLKAHAGPLQALADDPDGLVYRGALPPEMFDRMARGVWNKETNRPELLELLWKQMVDPATRRAGSAKFDGTWIRMWNQLGMDEGTKDYKSTTQIQYRREILDFITARAAAGYSDQDASPLEAQVKRALGPKAVDLVPSLANQAGPVPDFWKAKRN